jgi:transcriptional regulator with XRE-family HTH domain
MTETLGRRLRALRKERGLRLADVAGAAGISISWLNDMEHDRNSPSLDTLVRVAIALDTTAVGLLRGLKPYDVS